MFEIFHRKILVTINLFHKLRRYITTFKALSDGLGTSTDELDY